MKSCSPAIQNCHLNRKLSIQSGFTLIEIMIVIAIIGILSAIAAVSYQTQIRKTQIMTIYKEVNHFPLPYQTLIDDGAAVTNFSASGLNMPEQTKFCQFTVVAPVKGSSTPNAIICSIQNVSYLQGQTLSLDRGVDGKWQCHASAGIKVTYLPQACQ